MKRHGIASEEKDRTGNFAELTAAVVRQLAPVHKDLNPKFVQRLIGKDQKKLQWILREALMPRWVTSLKVVVDYTTSLHKLVVAGGYGQTLGNISGDMYDRPLIELRPEVSGLSPTLKKEWEVTFLSFGELRPRGREEVEEWFDFLNYKSAPVEVLLAIGAQSTQVQLDPRDVIGGMEVGVKILGTSAPNLAFCIENYYDRSGRALQYADLDVIKPNDLFAVVRK